MTAGEWAGLMLLGLAAVLAVVVLAAAFAFGLAIGELASRFIEVLR